MSFILTIKTDNAAFHEDDGRDTSAALGAECARILRELATRLDDLVSGGDEGALFDVNGNKVGTWRFQ